MRAIIWDFDFTIICGHTRGEVKLTTKEKSVDHFSKLISKDFMKLSSEIEKKGLHQGIASFAEQIQPNYFGGTRLIASILSAGFKDHPLFHIYGFNPAYNKLTHIDKNRHLQFLQDTLEIKDRANLLLIDDSLRNVQAAREAGYLAVHVTTMGFSMSSLSTSDLDTLTRFVG